MQAVFAGNMPSTVDSVDNQPHPSTTAAAIILILKRNSCWLVERSLPIILTPGKKK